ncbi:MULTISPECIES: hypothetical protein [Streptomyces]|uniref:Mercury transporter n=1 Tax=Streptomyces tardus TaxID=2780544 RepID=A0A949JIB2_9ACTN|nr:MULTISPECIES: hypothetical protein [Streptomyces]MBU7599145.1 hypothetical protein [Streptomyces tardus]RPK51726.1 hypothetical protein EES40_03985 [Streptomyces sp. ADI93-02]
MTDTGKPPRPTGALAAGGAGLVMVACCAGPVLLAGGALGALGDLLHDFWTIAAATAVVVAAVGLLVRRRRLDRGACCPPPFSPEDQEPAERPARYGRSG